MTILEAPRYRTIRVIAPGGIPYEAGSEIRVKGFWPNPADVEPINEAAKREMAYFKKYCLGNPFAPKSPYDEIVGDIFWPAVVASQFPPSPTPVKPEDATATMPRYAITQLSDDGEWVEREIAYLGWPEDRFDPRNEPARRVKAYYEAYKDHPKLRSAPFCLYKMQVVLPRLPDRAGRSVDYDLLMASVEGEASVRHEQRERRRKREAHMTAPPNWGQFQ